MTKENQLSIQDSEKNQENQAKTPTSSGIDKRKYRRIEIRETIRIYHDSNTYEEYFGDVSLGGCMIYSYRPIGTGQKVEIGVILADLKEMRILGTVKREKELQESNDFLTGRKRVVCKHCGWQGFWLNYGENSIKFVTDNHKFKPFEHIISFDSMVFACPRCEHELEHSRHPYYELGVKFDELNQIQLDKMVNYVKNNLQGLEPPPEASKTKTGRINRRAARIDVGYVPMDVTSIFEDGISLHETYIKNISSGGMFLYSNSDLQLNQEFRLQLGLKGQKNKFFINSMVMHKKMNRRSKSQKFGYGIKFTHFDQQTKQKLEKFIRALTEKDYKKYITKKRFFRNLLQSVAVGLNTYIAGVVTGIVATAAFFGLFKGIDQTLLFVRTPTKQAVQVDPKLTTGLQNMKKMFKNKRDHRLIEMNKEQFNLMTNTDFVTQEELQAEEYTAVFSPNNANFIPEMGDRQKFAANELERSQQAMEELKEKYDKTMFHGIYQDKGVGMPKIAEEMQEKMVQLNLKMIYLQDIVDFEP